MIWNDFGYAFRQLRRSPGYTAAAVLTLALALGSTVALWSIVERVLLRPLPYPEPDRLVGIAWTYPQAKPNATETGVNAEFVAAHLQGADSTAVLQGFTAAANLAWVEGSVTHTAVIAAQRVNRGFFPTLGLTPMLGRGFRAEEDRHGGPKAVVLSYALWQRVLGGDRAILGQPLRLNGESYTVVGVMGPELRVAAESLAGAPVVPDVWVPLALHPDDPGYDGENYQMLARLRPGESLPQLQAELDVLNEAFYASHPRYQAYVSEGAEKHVLRAWALREVLSYNVRRSLLALLSASGAVLLLGALNLAGLNVARAMRRRRELALRAALGASRAGLVRLLLAESLLIALAAAVLGMVVGSGLAPVLLASSPLAIPVLHAQAGMWALAPVAFGLVLAASLLFGLLPALLVLRAGTSAAAELKAGPSTGIGRGETRLGRGLIVAQVGIATVLLSAACLLLGSFLKLRAQPLGFVVPRLVVAQVSLKGLKYTGSARTNRFLTAVLDELQHAPGVSSAAAISGLPLDRGLNYGARPLDKPDSGGVVELRAVTSGYFEVAGVPVLQGRAIGNQDRAGGELVVLLSQTTARRWWPEGSPLGKLVRAGAQNYRVVGVVGDTVANGIAGPPRITLYVPFAQISDRDMSMLNQWITTSFVVRTNSEAPVVRTVERAIAHADPEMPVARFSSMQSFVDDSLATPRFFSVLTGSFAGFALLLVLVGLFGLLSYQVTARTREIGLRMAVGADRGRILRGVMRSGVTLSVVGLLLGLAGAGAVRHAVESVLGDVLETGEAPVSSVLAGSGVTAGAVAGLLLLAACAASLGPARRASTVEPAEALRAE